MVDLRPQYAYHEDKKQRILTNTRLIVQVTLNKLFFTICPSSSQMTFDNFADLEVYFLHHQDRDLQTNPIFVPFDQLKDIGFRSIAKISGLQANGQIKAKDSDGYVSASIDNIQLNLCISTVPYLQLFWEHFSKHNIQGNFGIS